MPVRPEDADAYELPELDDERDRLAPSSSHKLPEDDDTSEQHPLLGDEEDKRSSTDSADSGLGFVHAAHEDELVGATDVEALIARVSPRNGGSGGLTEVGTRHRRPKPPDSNAPRHRPRELLLHHGRGCVYDLLLQIERAELLRLLRNPRDVPTREGFRE